MVEKIYKRQIIGKILKYLESPEIIVIYGARQVGKTHILKYLITNNIKENYFYLDLEIPSLLELCNSGAEETYKYLLQKGADKKKKIFLLIDEIQYLQNPSNFLKIMHDHYSNIKLIVSGSSTFEIKKKFKESLTGRTINFEVYPLNFNEFLEFKEKNYRLEEKNSSKINQELILLAEEFIKFGGYPKIVLENDEEKKTAYLYQIIDTYIKKDIRDIGNIRDIDSFNKLVEILASQSGQLLNVLEISKISKINKDTLISYLDLLENTFIIKRVKPFHRNLRSELTKNPKVFLLDTGMMHLLWLKEFPKILHGESFETYVFAELIKAGKKINFWRTTNKQEIDFIINDKKLRAIEAKINFQNSDSSALNFFSEKYNSEKFITALKGDKNNLGIYPWELLKIII